MMMKELSIFVDESGDFGEYAYHSPYYIISFVLHDQGNSINQDLALLENELRNIGYPNHCIHVGPTIRQEEEYRDVDIETRQKIAKKTDDILPACQNFLVRSAYRKKDSTG